MVFRGNGFSDDEWTQITNLGLYLNLGAFQTLLTVLDRQGSIPIGLSSWQTVPIRPRPHPTIRIHVPIATSVIPSARRASRRIIGSSLSRAKSDHPSTHPSDTTSLRFCIPDQGSSRVDAQALFSRRVSRRVSLTLPSFVLVST